MSPTATATATASPSHSSSGRAVGPDRRSFSGLFSDLWRETTTLVQEEAALAKADVSEKVTEAVHATGAIAVGGGIAFAGFLMLLLAASNALMLMLPIDIAPWLAPLIVGAVVIAIGLMALASGRSKLKAGNLKPTRSMASLRQDGKLVKEHLQ